LTKSGRLLCEMIISHKHKFIFIKTRKTAGTSLEISLSTICGPNDVITAIDDDDEKARRELGGRGPQNFKLPMSAHSLGEVAGMLFGKSRKQFYNHMAAQEIKELMHTGQWDSYYKFCFERNPWDKVLSQYNARGGDRAFGNVEGYITSGEVARLRGYDMYSIKRNVVVDDIFKFEEMDESLQTISERLNLNTPLQMPTYRAKGNRRKDKRHYHDVLSDEERELVAVIFAREIKLLGYEY